MAKKQGIDDIISGLGDIMPPPLNGKKNNLSSKNGGGVRRLQPRAGEKIAPPLGEVVAKRSYSHGLIKEAEIKSWATEYDFYLDFLQKAQLFFNHYEPKAEYTPFFSFTPQYGQLNQRQMDYYSLWRHKVRRGEYITKIDFSYVLLFIYEIINLTPETIPPKKGLSLLCGIWKSYRQQFYPLDKYLSEWVCDYCLIHGLDCPSSLIESFLPDILKKTSLPEFYLCDLSPGSAKGTLLTTLSDYDYRCSKYLTGENKDVFEKHIKAALSCLDNDTEKETVTVTRDSYIGALCLCTKKRRMSISYISLNHSEENREKAENAVKYAENMVRMELGIKGRHQNVNLQSQDKQKLDSYFASNLLTGQRAEQLKAELNDSKYQPLSTGFSSKEAELIEQSSRSVIELLESDTEITDQTDINRSPSPEGTVTSAKPDPNVGSAPMEGKVPKEEEQPQMDEISLGALMFIYNGDNEGLVDYCLAKATLPEAVADEINYFAFLNIDDIILEEHDGSYTVSEEYKEVVEKWLKITDR